MLPCTTSRVLTDGINRHQVLHQARSPRWSSNLWAFYSIMPLSADLGIPCRNTLIPVKASCLNWNKFWFFFSGFRIVHTSGRWEKWTPLRVLCFKFLTLVLASFSHQNCKGPFYILAGVPTKSTGQYFQSACNYTLNGIKVIFPSPIRPSPPLPPSPMLA